MARGHGRRRGVWGGAHVVIWPVPSPCTKSPLSCCFTLLCTRLFWLKAWVLSVPWGCSCLAALLGLRVLVDGCAAIFPLAEAFLPVGWEGLATLGLGVHIMCMIFYNFSLLNRHGGLCGLHDFYLISVPQATYVQCI